MVLRGLAPNSVSTYVRCARQFLAHVDRPLAAVKRRDIEGYLHTLVDKARSPRTRNVQLGAIRCLLLPTVRRDPSATIPRAKVPRVVLQILSGTEVLRLLAATTSLKYRAIFMLAYGAGLRVGEITTLQTSDIDSQRMLIRVRHGKTGQRYVMLSPRVLAALRRYWKAYRPARHRTVSGIRQATSGGTAQSRIDSPCARKSSPRGGDQKARLTAHAQTLLRHAPARNRRQYAHGATLAWPCVPGNDGEVGPPGAGVRNSGLRTADRRLLSRKIAPRPPARLSTTGNIG